MAVKGTEVSVRITAGSVIVTLLFLALVALVWYLREIVLILLTAIVIASAMEPGVRSFTRRGLPRVLAVILIYLIIATVFFGILFFFLPPILDDAANFLARLPDALRSIHLSTEALNSSFLPLGDVASLLSSSDILRSVSSSLSGSGGVLATLSAFFGGIVSFILVVVFSFYFSVQETGVDDFLHVVTPPRYQAYVLGLWRRSQEKIGKWMQGQLLLAALVGVMIYLLLTIFGIPYALLLSVLAAVFELIPVFGQFLAAIPAIAVATVNMGIGEGVLVALIFLIVQQFEAHLVYPLVVKKIVGVPPLLVILALLIGGKLAGFVGVLLSVPIAAVVRELVSDLESRRAHDLVEKREKE